MSEERIRALEEKLEALVRREIPSLEELDGWVPFDIEPKSKIVLASKKIGNADVTRAFPSKGPWASVFSQLSEREELLDALEAESQKLGRHTFVSEETETEESKISKAISFEEAAPEHIHDLPMWAIYLVEPHGEMIWTGKKRMVLKTQRYEDHEDQPLLLVEDGKAYGIIELFDPSEIGWEAFEALRHRHQVSREEAEKWGWMKYKTLWAYFVRMIDRFQEPLQVQVPRGVQTFVRVSNLQFEKIFKASAFEEAAPEHIHDSWARSAVTLEKKLGKSGASIALRYHKGEIQREEAMEAIKPVLERYRKQLEAIACRKFSEMSKKEIRTIPSEVAKRIDRMVTEKLQDFESILKDAKKARGLKK